MLKFVEKPVMADNPHYDPKRLLDTMRHLLRVKNDRQLAAKLEAEPAQICKIRKRRTPVSSALLISMHEETGISIRQLRALMGDYRTHTGPNSLHPASPQPQVLNGISDLLPSAIHLRGERGCHDGLE